MRNKQQTLEFLASSLPPCLPGDNLYWVHETGKIRIEQGGIKGITLKRKNQWYIMIDDHDPLKANADRYTCTSFDAALSFRNKMKCKYRVLIRDDDGMYEVEGKRYRYATLGSVKGKNVKPRKDFVDVIVRENSLEGKDAVIGLECEDGDNMYYVLNDKERTQVNVNFVG